MKVYKDVKDIVVESLNEDSDIIRLTIENVVEKTLKMVDGILVVKYFDTESREFKTDEIPFSRIIKEYKLSINIDEDGNMIDIELPVVNIKGRRKVRRR